jgi:hypothetical protein
MGNYVRHLFPASSLPRNVEPAKLLQGLRPLLNTPGSISCGGQPTKIGVEPTNLNMYIWTYIYILILLYRLHPFNRYE